jgi:hypothetical protein
MALKSIYESQDDVPEALREFYTDDKGKFVLAVEDIDNHPKVRGVITANAENKRKRDEYKAKVSELEAKFAEIPEDFDAEQWATLKTGADPAKKDEQIQSMKQVYEGKFANLQKKYDTDIAAKDAELAERDGYIDQSLVVTGLKDHLLDVGVNPDLLDGALSSLRPSVKVQRDDKGQRKAVVETDLGEIDVGTFVKDWAGSKGKAYLRAPTGPDPKGSTRTVNGAKTISRKDWDALAPGDRMAKAKDGFKVVDAA